MAARASGPIPTPTALRTPTTWATWIAACSKGTAGSIYSALCDFGTFMTEKNIRSRDMKTREDNHDVSMFDERDRRCVDRNRVHGECGPGRQ